MSHVNPYGLLGGDLGGTLPNPSVNLSASSVIKGQVFAPRGTSKSSSSSGGASLQLTDGTTDLTGVTKITVSGATVGGTANNATLTISDTGGGGGSGSTSPEELTGLVFWYATDDINLSGGSFVSRMRDRNPSTLGSCLNFPYVNSISQAGAKVSASPLNGKPTIDLIYQAQFPAPLWVTDGGTGGVTYFIVYNPSAATSGYACLIGGSNSLSGGVALYTSYDANQLAMTKSGVAEIGAATTPNNPGSWQQANATYNATTGAYAFRLARTAAGSGTGLTGAGVGPIQFIGSDEGAYYPTYGLISIAEIIIYDAVFNSSEITGIENYLNSKWDV
ncbi:unnamed protein product [Sphagnum balticum]